jgi:hypothetical protein
MSIRKDQCLLENKKEGICQHNGLIIELNTEVLLENES